MNDNKVLPFPVVPRPVPEDTTEEEVKVEINREQMLERAFTRKFKNLLIIGIEENGTPFYDADAWEMKALMFLIERLRHKLNMKMDALETGED